MKILFVFPSEREASVAKLRSAPVIVGSRSYAGDAMREELAESRPSLVLLAGFCGALDPSLKPGSIIVGRHVIAPGEDVIDPDRFLYEEIRSGLRSSGLPFIASRLLTVPYAAATKDEKRELWNEFGAGGVDMETYWVAEACKKARVNWIAIRAVVDPSNEPLPASLASWEAPGDEQSSLKIAAKRPLEWGAYGKLGLHYRAARKSLKAALPHVVRAARNAKTVETLELV
jgi:adenosylhomocysteine nucleosidase